MRYFIFIGGLLLLIAAQLMQWVRDTIAWGIFVLIIAVIVIPIFVPNKYFIPKRKK